MAHGGGDSAGWRSDGFLTRARSKSGETICKCPERASSLRVTEIFEVEVLGASLWDALRMTNCDFFGS
jgi:hypothetical protein